MCGIAGYMGTRDLPKEQIKNCLKSLGHRGPDGHGIYSYRHGSGSRVTLLHTRLSIIDLESRSDQPMRFGQDTLVFNGEIYNYLEARGRLAGRGEFFETAGDTEVLLRTLSLEGISGLDRLEGMWAFAHYNEQSGSLTLCRDRFAEKPLFIHRTQQGLFFASETRALSLLVGKTFTPDLNQAKRYLTDGYRVLHRHNPSFHEGVEILPAGTALTRTPSGEETSTTYWTPTFCQDPGMTFDEAVAGVRKRLIRSVELRLRADVPLAFCMSGGVDSNGLISIAKNELGFDVHGFTVVNRDARYAEMDLVREAVELQGLNHTEINLEQADFLPRLQRLTHSRQAPVATISYYVHWLMLRAIAKQGYKVSVSGTGADELFTGYYDHYAMYLRSVADNDELFQTSLANWHEYIGPVIRNPRLQDPLVFVDTPEMRDHITLDRERYAAMIDDPMPNSFAEKAYTPELLRNRMLNELFTEVVPVLLHEDDHNAMDVSVENRSPYLDRDLFEFCQTIPTRHLMRNGYNKAVLRKALRGIAPDAIVNERRKVGFNAPIMDLLDVTDPEVRKTILAPGPVYSFVNKEAVRQMLASGQCSNSESKFLFSFLGVKFLLESKE